MIIFGTSLRIIRIIHNFKVIRKINGIWRVIESICDWNVYLKSIEVQGIATGECTVGTSLLYCRNLTIMKS
jgi:hypothetical protein